MTIARCHNEEPNPAYSGGNADVFRGVLRNRRVAIKVVRIYSADPDRHRSVGPFAYAKRETLP